jgi:hypothetical protein
MRAQIDEVRRRRYPTASEAPAKWLGLAAGKLMSVQARLEQLTPLEADREHVEKLLVDLNSCYDDLEILGRADTTQVADFVVSALHRWFVATDPDCDYLFTSGIMFEIEPLYDGPPPEVFHDEHQRALDRMDEVLFRITMPGGALGSAFHIPLVTHEIGHVLMARLERNEADDAITGLLRSDDDEIFKNWVKEIIADTICGFVSGPAGFFALCEKLRGGGDLPDEEHPHNLIRLRSLSDEIRERFESVCRSHKGPDAAWLNWSIASSAELLAMQYTDHDQKHDYTEPSHRLIKMLPEIRRVASAIAREYIAALEYTPKQMDDDLNEHLSSMFHAIPPFETHGDLRDRRPTDLATILNVGWFVAAFAMDRLKIEAPEGLMKEGPLLMCLDQLILKAIELSEIRRDWASA